MFYKSAIIQGLKNTLKYLRRSSANAIERKFPALRTQELLQAENSKSC